MRGRPILLIAIAGVFAAMGFARAEETSPPQAADATYNALLADLKSGHTDIDYGALREAYANSSHYDPYGEPPAMGAMIEAAKAHDCAKVLAAAGQLLDADFTDILAHVLSANCAQQQGDQSSARFHRDVAMGLIRSIARSGDGTSADSPYIVIAVKEEYAFLDSQGYRVTMQALVRCGTAECDAMSVVDEKGAKATYFFDVSRAMGWLTKGLGASKPGAAPAK